MVLALLGSAVSVRTPQSDHSRFVQSNRRLWRRKKSDYTTPSRGCESAPGLGLCWKEVAEEADLHRAL